MQVSRGDFSSIKTSTRYCQVSTTKIYFLLIWHINLRVGGLCCLLFWFSDMSCQSLYHLDHHQSTPLTEEANLRHCAWFSKASSREWQALFPLTSSLSKQAPWPHPGMLPSQFSYAHKDENHPYLLRSMTDNFIL